MAGTTVMDETLSAFVDAMNARERRGECFDGRDIVEDFVRRVPMLRRRMFRKLAVKAQELKLQQHGATV